MVQLRALTTLVLVPLIAPRAQAQVFTVRDSAVYAAALDSLDPSGPVILIRQFYRPVTKLGARPIHSSQPAVPESLQAPLRASIDSGGGNLQSALRTWRRARWIASTQVVVRTPQGGRDITIGEILSRIGYAPDNQSAVLYAALVCGIPCGKERVVRLAVAPDGRWRVTYIGITKEF